MAEEPERLSHSNRGMAALVVVAVVLLAGWLAVSNRMASDAESESDPTTTPTTTTTTSTTRETATTSTDSATPITSGEQSERSEWWWSLVGPDETDIRMHELSGGGSLLFSSSNATPDRVPLMRRLDHDGETLVWESEGRVSTGWIGPVRVIDDVVVTFNRESPDRAVMVGFDFNTGSRLWISQFRLGLPLDPTTPALVALGEETAVMVQSVELGLVRVALPTGSPLWTVSDVDPGVILGPIRLKEGRLGLTMQRDGRVEMFDAMTGLPVAGPPFPLGCQTLRGPRPILYLFSEDRVEECVVVADYQKVQIWNKGFETLTVGPEPGLTIPSDDSVGLDELGITLVAGDNSIESSPYPLAPFRYVPPEQSGWAGVELGVDGVGGIRVGMTISEASSILGQPLLPDALFDPICPLGGIEGDPYSPRFVLSRQQPHTIVDILPADSNPLSC